jgi:hypothetical protein
MNKKEYIGHLANVLVSNNTTMTGENIAHHLNEIGFKTSYGTEYEGGRGTYKLISDTYDWFVAKGKQADADNIAHAFTKPDGTYAYNK